MISLQRIAEPLGSTYFDSTSLWLPLIVSYDSIMSHPLYKITAEILSLIVKISEQLGEIKAANLIKPRTELRKINKVKTIQSTLEIEGNTLDLEQITAIIDERRVIGPEKEILEAKNAIKIYHSLVEFDPFKLTDFCRAHAILMDGLIKEPGKLHKMRSPSLHPAFYAFSPSQIQ